MKNEINCHLYQGFTLIDLLIVLAILLITAGIGLPSFANLLEENRAYNYTKTLAKQMVFARHYALNYNTSVTICPLKHSKCDTQWKEDISVFIDYNRNRRFEGKDKLLGLLEDPPHTDTLLYPRRGITYRSDGSINGFQSGTFRYCPRVKDSQFSLGLVVNQAGRTRYRQDKIDCLAK